VEIYPCSYMADGVSVVYLKKMEASQWNERYATTELVWSAEPNRFVVEECAPLRPGRALDVAAGEGRNAIWLARRGWFVTAVDFSSVALAKGEQMAMAQGAAVADRVVWVCADVRSWHPPPGAFDLAVIAYLHLPAPDRRKVLSQSVAGLAPGGVLLVVGHDRSNLEVGVGGPQDPLVLYSPQDLAADLAAVEGIVVERAETVERSTPQGVALDALVRARKAAAA
jgi:SAM-dependent methyltransferase